VPADLSPANTIDLASCVDAGTACTTDNLGACKAGHLACSAGGPVCVPDVTTQPCDTGRSGPCKAGTQSCIGAALGTCTSQVMPAARENCFNDIDDDCNGKVDDGCPNGLVLGAAHSMGDFGGTGGYPASPAFCPANSYVVREQFDLDRNVQSVVGITIWCAEPLLSRGASNYSVSLLPTLSAGFAGGNSITESGGTDCGTSGFVAGYQTWVRSDTYVRGLFFYCANGTATLNADNSLSIRFADNGNNGGLYFASGNSVFVPCPPGEVLVGYDGRTGAYMDEITPYCAPIQVTYK
jgi:hypothetical protein